jgi:TolB-like protein
VGPFGERLRVQFRKVPRVTEEVLMRTIAHKTAFLAGILIFTYVGPSLVIAQDLRPTANALAEKIVAAGRKKVAVVDFTDLQGNATQLGRFIAEELSIALADDARQFVVIDRTSIRVILHEHKLAAEGLIDPETARKLGQIAGVDTLVTGTITPLGDSVHVGLKALDTESAMLITGLTVEIPRTKAIDDLLGGVADSSEQAGGEHPNPAATQGTAAFPTGDFLFSFRGCRMGTGAGLADQIVCWGSITNRGTQKEDVAIGKETYLVDNTGHQAPINWFSIGGAEPGPCCGVFTMEPDLPLQFWFDSRGFSTEVQSVTVIFFANGHKTILRNVKLQGR